jgi:hypothetical protein
VLATFRARLTAVAFFVGVLVLGWLSLSATGGLAHLFEYSAHPTHKFTARAMLHGALNLRRHILGTGHDEQVYNGAGFTNWGFGVPLLQLPFHAAVPLLKRWIHASYFPDRLIFFVYLAALLPVLWAGVHRMVFPEERRASRQLSSLIASWCVTLLVLTYSLFDLTSFRFIVYEETIAYFVVAQLLAIALYARFLDTRKTRWVVALALAASLGFVIRPTGLPYLGMWALLVALEGPFVRLLAWFAAAAAPGVLFWAFGNWVRSGSPISLGYQNANPGFPVHYQMLRFGSQCVDTGPRFRALCHEIFVALFTGVAPHSPIFGDCGVMFESRLPTDDVYMGAGALLLLVLSLCWCAIRRERRLSFYLPHLTIAALFLAYSRAGAGLAWRYAGDFWPLVVLVGLKELRRLRVERLDVVCGLAVTSALFATLHLQRAVYPALPGLQVADQAVMRAAEEEHDREDATPQPPLPSKLHCGDSTPPWARGDGVGWAPTPTCAVGIVTNVYIGVPPGPGSKFKLRFVVDHPIGPTLPVYLNGRNYTAQRTSDGYEASVDIDQRRLRSPVVVAAAEWSLTAPPPLLRLLSVELEARAN